MDYTRNYRLPQWVKSDRIMMEDFNEMCQNIESSLTANAKAAAAAQATANSAITAKPYVTGSYTGDGKSKTVFLGFRPSFLIVTDMGATYNINTFPSCLVFSGMTGGQTLKKRCEITNTGFTVYPEDEEHFIYPSLNHEGSTYEYIAFR